MRCADPTVNGYLFSLLRFSDYAPETADGFERHVWLDPREDGWSHYTITDKQSPARKRR